MDAITTAFLIFGGVLMLTGIIFTTLRLISPHNTIISLTLSGILLVCGVVIVLSATTVNASIRDREIAEQEFRDRTIPHMATIIASEPITNIFGAVINYRLIAEHNGTIYLSKTSDHRFRINPIHEASTQDFP